MKCDHHQGGILPADSFPFCASFSRQFATKTGFFIPEGEINLSFQVKAKQWKQNKKTKNIACYNNSSAKSIKDNTLIADRKYKSNKLIGSVILSQKYFCCLEAFNLLSIYAKFWDFIKPVCWQVNI